MPLSGRSDSGIQGFMNITQFLKRERGQGLVEYALILVLVAIVVIAILLVLGPQVGGVFSNVVANLERVGIGGGYTVTFNGSPNVGKSGTTSCTYTASVPVKVMKGSLPGSGVSVSGTVTLTNNAGNNPFSFSVSGTSNGSGIATLAGSRTTGCHGTKGTAAISGGPSQSVTVH